MDMVEATGDIAYFRQVEVDISILIVCHKGVDGEDIVIFRELFWVGKFHFKGLLVDAKDTVDIFLWEV